MENNARSHLNCILCKQRGNSDFIRPHYLTLESICQECLKLYRNLHLRVFKSSSNVSLISFDGSTEYYIQGFPSVPNRYCYPIVHVVSESGSLSSQVVPVQQISTPNNRTLRNSIDYIEDFRTPEAVFLISAAIWVRVSHGVH